MKQKNKIKDVEVKTKLNKHLTKLEKSIISKKRIN